MAGYKYGASSKPMSEQEVASRLASARATAAANANGIPSPPAGPPPAVRDLRPPEPPKQLKGAVKVSGFPERSKYPFRQIADDGGVWEIDPAAFKVTPGAIVQAARKWAEGRNVAVKVITDDGMVYVQFKAGA